MQKEHKEDKRYKEEKINQLQERSQLMNKGRESLDVSPQAGDQSNREPLKKVCN